MIRSRFFRDPNVGFNENELGPPITADQIRAVVPENFAGKEDFVDFYSCHNGGSLTGKTRFYRDLYCEVRRDDFNDLYIAVLLSIPRTSDEVIVGSMLRLRDAIMEGVRDLDYKGADGATYSDFVAAHIPISDDGHGNYCWIHASSGRIRHVNFEFYEKGPMEVAPSFIDFVSNFVQRRRPEGRVAHI